MHYYMIIFLAVFIVIGDARPRKVKTECQKNRERESMCNAYHPLGVIPECDENGDYKLLQCYKDGETCACWNKNGYPVTEPSSKIKHCECLLQRHDVETNGLVGAHKPQCYEDGKFKKVQCHSSTGHCWCAHPETGAMLTEPARGKPKC